MAKVIDTKDNRVAVYLEKHGTIQPFEAWSKLGIYRLSSCIFNLRKAGYSIDTQLVEVKNQFKEVCRIAAYRLVNSAKSGKPKAKASPPLKATKPKSVKPRVAAAKKKVDRPIKTKVDKPVLASKPVVAVTPRIVAVVSAKLPVESRFSTPAPDLKRIIEESNYNPSIRSRYPAPSVKRY